MSREDKLVSAFMSTDHPFVIEQSVEVHYNHFGSRGVVDLVKKFSNQSSDRHVRTALYEMKSEYALEEATGANEIIRQCKKHAEYYFADKGSPTIDSRDLTLVFELTQDTFDHVVDNIGMYWSLHKKPINGCEFEVSCYDLENDVKINPLTVYNEHGEVSDLWKSLREQTDDDPFGETSVEMR